MWVDRLRFDGKRALVTGAASGMGRATAATLIELGAEVHALDLNEPDLPVASFEPTDLRDATAIERSVAAVGGPVHVLVNCAGMPQTFPPTDVWRCNFVGLRHLTEAVLTHMPRGGAIGCISSIAGEGWQPRVTELAELMKELDFDATTVWFDHNRGDADPYVLSKQAVNAYLATRCASLAQRGIRINSISPGAVDTSMRPHFEQVVGEEGFTSVASVIGRVAQPQEPANVLVFLLSDAASYVTGSNVIVDGGFIASIVASQQAWT